MDELDSRVYYGLKEALRKADAALGKGISYSWKYPVILIDLWCWEVFYFDDESDALEHLQKNNTEWDDSPPDGEDEELIILKYCSTLQKEDYPHTNSNYKPYKEINGMMHYRERSFVSFEPELIINVSI